MPGILRKVPEYTTILAQVFSTCGQYYAAGTVEGQIAVWKVSNLLARGNVDRGKEMVKWSMREGVFSMICTDKFLIVGGKEVVRGWDWDKIISGEAVTDCDWEIDMRGKGDINSMIIISDSGPDGQLVLGMGDNNIYVMNLETRETTRVLAGHTDYVHCVSCGKGDGQRTIASGGEDGTVRLWDIRQCDSLHTLTPSEKTELDRQSLGKQITAVALSQDWLACGGGPRLALWHLKSLAVATPLPPLEQEVKAVSFHDEVVMIGGRGRTLFQANFSGEITAEVSVSSSMIYSIAHSDNPSVLCVGGSSSYIDMCAPNYNYKDVTLTFPVE